MRIWPILVVKVSFARAEADPGTSILVRAQVVRSISDYRWFSKFLYNKGTTEPRWFSVDEPSLYRRLLCRNRGSLERISVSCPWSCDFSASRLRTRGSYKAVGALISSRRSVQVENGAASSKWYRKPSAKST